MILALVLATLAAIVIGLVLNYLSGGVVHPARMALIVGWPFIAIVVLAGVLTIAVETPLLLVALVAAGVERAAAS